MALLVWINGLGFDPQINKFPAWVFANIRRDVEKKQNGIKIGNQ